MESQPFGSSQTVSSTISHALKRVTKSLYLKTSIPIIPQHLLSQGLRGKVSGHQKQYLLVQGYGEGAKSQKPLSGHFLLAPHNISSALLTEPLAWSLLLPQTRFPEVLRSLE